MLCENDATVNYSFMVANMINKYFTAIAEEINFNDSAWRTVRFLVPSVRHSHVYDIRLFLKPVFLEYECMPILSAYMYITLMI